jgi:hypothetical protein
MSMCLSSSRSLVVPGRGGVALAAPWWHSLVGSALSAGACRWRLRASARAFSGAVVVGLSLARARGKACPTPRRRSDLSPAAGASTASQTRPFASARRRRGGPGTSRAPCGAGFAKVWFARGFARTCSRPSYSRPLHVMGILHPEALEAIRVVGAFDPVTIRV